jgi:hypothetical protein
MSRFLTGSALICLLVAAACGGNDEPRPIDPMADTAAGVQPRTQQEIEAEGTPMTPEQAAELGVIDTTIQVTEEP